MMDRSHFEKTLSVCCLEIHNLKNYRRGFYYVYDSRYKDNERRADQKRHSHSCSAEKKRARVTHKYFGGIYVVNEKADTSTKKYDRQKKLCVLLVDCGKNGKEYHYCGCYRRGKPVDSVSEIDAVDDPANKNNCHNIIKYPKLNVYVEKGNMK